MKINLFSGISYLDKVIFTKHMSVMIKSGITTLDALSALKEQIQSAAFRNLIDKIIRDIENGQPLASALKKHPHVFDQFYVNIIHIGEETGSLEKNLDYLAIQLKKDYNLQKKIQGALLYPSFILLGTFSIIFFIGYYILPQLVSFFSSLDIDLPVSTQILIFIGSIMKSHGILILIGLVTGLAGFGYLIRKPPFNKLYQRFLLSIPIIGVFIQNSVLVGICRNLGIMLKSGLSITASLDILSEGMTNLVYRDYVIRLKKAVSRGRNLSQELNLMNYRHIPLIMIKMVAVGEKTGALDQSLLYLSDLFEEEIENMAKNMTTLIEPVLLVIIGTIVGFIALAIISPIYQLTGSLRGR